MLFDFNNNSKISVVMEGIKAVEAVTENEFTIPDYVIYIYVGGPTPIYVGYNEDKELRDSDYQMLKDDLNINNEQYLPSRRTGPVTDPIDQAKFRQY